MSETFFKDRSLVFLTWNCYEKSLDLGTIITDQPLSLLYKRFFDLKNSTNPNSDDTLEE